MLLLSCTSKNPREGSRETQLPVAGEGGGTDLKAVGLQRVHCPQPAALQRKGSAIKGHTAYSFFSKLLSSLLATCRIGQCSDPISSHQPRATNGGEKEKRGAK
ncbi:hypothetical protein, variant 2 [Cladophialophora immunda]|uniref:Uncharacterized protein n=1 Tax=Cladophialophora immunda TaxID=569365 RepID=A0A0D2CGA4_9EURO|nr:uncharacterized protein PV07_05921 [Cladophialophora immunda]XP_016250369.1 hypothetical protein, variant 1 [Cladophialophora immunda]XP_016250370.1 hypothetical protein, variant 2 [Cladophialophora immunda]KIW30152.1 hypothetical protein PV07_05921 [Cladophialophora immunda]KIW30153.1 hypothetical protein, variant 1 [Cladophialophora immunda]KIW30154.1 hypothetical protein, variant 2 [Cladophialophora immunda]OQU95900.1 hypothetical protein CLAIMM_02060 isoform 1 [Cladophialophora immunda